MSTLLVVGNAASLTADDTFLYNRLTTQGRSVSYIDDDGTPDFTNIDLVVMSTTCGSQASLGTKYDAVSTCGIVSLSGYGRPHSGYAGGVAGTGTFQTTWALLASGDPLAAGLTGTVTILPSAPTTNWFYIPNTSLGSGATLVWGYDGTKPTRATVSRYSQGAIMYSGAAAPSRRAVVSISGTAPLANFNSNGLAIIDAAVTWVSAIPPTANAGSSLTANALGTPSSTTYDIALSGTGTDPSSGTLSYSWTIVSGTGVLINQSTATPTLRVSKYGATVVVGLTTTSSASGLSSPQSTKTVTVAPVANIQIASNGVLLQRQIFTVSGGQLN